ncbi:MAG TPA: carboxypeptidase-like regulatory domain-containing protein [Bryobacteraceae bacterium]
MNTDKKSLPNLRLSVSICGAFLFRAAASAQNGGTITGTITDPDGRGVEHVTVRLKSSASGEVSEIRGSDRGFYTFSKLLPGAYDLTIPEMGFTFAKLEKKNIAVKPGQTVRLDLRLELSPTGNLGTPGDDFFGFNRSKWAPSGKPAPRTAEGKPDLSGVWQSLTGGDMETPSLLPWADAVVKQREANGGIDGPSNSCLPADPLLIAPLGYKIVQTPKVIVMMWEGQPPNFRQVFLDQTDHSKAWFPAWLGHSIAKWEGDTLVVDTAAFNGRSWIGLYPYTEKLHAIERWRRPELAHIQREVTVDDPETFTKPWKIRSTWDLDLGEEIHEYICNENETDVKHMKAEPQPQGSAQK